MEKRFYKSPDKKICGLCGGFADYFNIDPTLVRLLLVLIMLITAIFPITLAYLIIAIIVPSAPDNYNQIFNNTAKKLYKSNDKKVSGVCAGFSEYFGINDPTILRICFVVIMLLTAVIPCLIFYLVAASIMPSIENADANAYYQQQYNAQPNGQYQPPFNNAQYQQPFNGQPNGQYQQPNNYNAQPSNAPEQQQDTQQPQNSGDSQPTQL